MKIPSPLRDPWAISQSGFELVLSVWSRDELFSEVRKLALERRAGEPMMNSQPIETANGVRVISMRGPMFRHASMLTDVSGATSYEGIKREMNAALSDRSVRAIVFDVDSPGGDAKGCAELSQAIYDARGRKPMIAYCGGTMASAAYWLASAADSIVVDRTAILGSIGVKALLVDESKRDEVAGIKKYEIVSSQSPNKTIDPAAPKDRQRVQDLLSKMAGVFVSDVARNRSVTDQAVLSHFGQGGEFVGDDAIAAGMADELGSLDSVIQKLAAQPLFKPAAIAATKGSKMAVKKEGTPEAVASMTDENCDSCGSKMSGKAYCSTCYGDECDEDEEESKALGLDAKATKSERRARILALSGFEALAISATDSKTINEARGKIASYAADAAKLPGIQAELSKLQRDGRQATLRAQLEAGIKSQKLSLGVIQKFIPLVLRGEQKAAWCETMSKLESITDQTVLDAACSVVLAADDLTAIGEYIKSASPVAAENFPEPERDTKAESQELDGLSAEIKKHAEAARITLDRGKKPAATK